MKFTIGICCGPEARQNLEGTITSLIAEAIVETNDDTHFKMDHNLILDNFEVLLIGDFESKPLHASWVGMDDAIIGRTIQFDETQKKGWITRKKNILVEEAKYENVVLMHDYFTFEPNWYKGWLEFGNDFQIANNVVLNLEGTRHSDWTVDPYKVWKEYPQWDWKMWDLNLPYEATGLTKIQYISGGYWVAKKQFMLDNPLDESLLWGEKEDIEWSSRIREKTEFKFNPNSAVRIMKPGKWAPGLLDSDVLETVKKANGL